MHSTWYCLHGRDGGDTGSADVEWEGVVLCSSRLVSVEGTVILGGPPRFGKNGKPGGGKMVRLVGLLGVAFLENGIFIGFVKKGVREVWAGNLCW